MENSPCEIIPKTLQLAEADQAYLDQRERTIEQGLHTFLVVGTALLEISSYKSGVLFKNGFGTFENYCRERWGIGQSQAYRLMGAANVVKALSPIGEKEKIPLPANECQARPLMRLKSEKTQEAAWRAAVKKAEGGEITGKLVGQAVREQIKQGAKTTQKERPAAKAKASARKLEARHVDLILGKLGKIKKAAKGNAVIAGLILEIKELLPANGA